MKNNIFKKVTYFIIIIVIVSTFSLKIYATTTSELKSQQSDLQEKIDETNTEMSGVESEMTDALNEINDLNVEIEECEAQITELEIKLEDLNLSIEEKNKSIEEQEKKYEEQQELLDKRLVAIYQTGNTTYLDMLLSSSSLTDFISKYYLIEELAECDQNLLTGIQELKEQIESEKNELESTKQEVESAKNSLEINKDYVQTKLKEKQNLVSKLSSEEKALQTKLDEFEQDKIEIQKELAQIAAENKRKAEEAAKLAAKKAAAAAATSSTSTTSSSSSSSSSTTTSSSSNVSSASSGYISPLSGKTKNNITTGYMSYKGHTGVDFATSAGTPVLAVKSGTVVSSIAKKNSSGNYTSYGEYIIIDHGDGTMTLYAHMQEGSRKVQKGDTVSQGQQIGNVGSTGNSTGPHLHFEVRINGSCVNPTNYLP